MFKIFIVEDDQGLVGLLEEHLRRFGYEPKCAADFGAVIADFERFKPHLVLLDVNLPMFDGFYWCRQIRNGSTCPIISFPRATAKWTG
ncbi:response regulator [Paenibacillus sp. VCA1]|uniref:response regulator n=1 Tax=Paenibacillus sp. VCA1 TaxID=3039148 RepID=UPI0037CBB33F